MEGTCCYSANRRCAPTSAPRLPRSRSRWSLRVALGARRKRGTDREAHAAVSGVSGPTTVDTPIGSRSRSTTVWESLAPTRGADLLRQPARRPRAPRRGDARRGRRRTERERRFRDAALGRSSPCGRGADLLADAYGKFTRRRFYRDAAWMLLPSFFTIEQVDAEGRTIGAGDVVNSGLEHTRLPRRHLLRPKAARDSMDVRLRVAARLHGAKNFAEEALIELRTRCTRSARSRCSPAPSRFACAGR